MLLGTVVNVVAIIVGSILGAFLFTIPDKFKNTLMQGMGLVVVILGIKMGLEAENFLLIIFNIAIGGIIGESLKISDRLDQLGQWLEFTFSKGGKNQIANGFITGTLVYTIGAMAVLGALDSGLKLDHNILYIKSMLDGFTAIIFASTLGIGVIFSAVPVLIYQGSIALMARYINLLFNQEMLEAIIVDITATGGILIIAIALNILEIKKVKVANLLPAILIAPITLLVIKWLENYF